MVPHKRPLYPKAEGSADLSDPVCERRPLESSHPKGPRRQALVAGLLTRRAEKYLEGVGAAAMLCSAAERVARQGFAGGEKLGKGEQLQVFS